MKPSSSIRSKKWLTFILLAIISPAGFALTNPQKTESFWQKILRITGISATPKNQRDVDQVKPGKIWIANFANGTRFEVQTAESDFTSPIFLREAGFILALHGDKVVRISLAEGTSETAVQIKGIFKLVGVSKDDADKVLVLTDEDQDGCPTVGLLSLSAGQVDPLPHGKSDEDQTLINHLQSWLRVYDDETRLDTKRQNNNSWVDVVFKEKNKDAVNVSKCQRINCTQPSLSDDHKRVVFIKEN